MKTSSKTLLITKEANGTILSDCFCFVVESTNGITRYNHVNIPKGSDFRVIRYNIATERIIVYVTIKGKRDTFLAELDYNTIMNNSVLENPNIYKNIESILVKKEEVPILSRETIRDILIIVSFGISLFLLGVFI